MSPTREQVTYKQLVLFRANGRNYLQHIGPKKNHLSYAIQKMLKRTERIFEEYQGTTQDLRAEHALVKDGAFVTNAKGETEIDASKAKAYNKAIRDLEGKAIDIEVYHTKSIPEDTEQVWMEYFIPFVIGEFQEPELVADHKADNGIMEIATLPPTE